MEYCFLAIDELNPYLFIFLSASLEGPLTLYRGMVKQGKLQHDMHQEKVAIELEGLLDRLEQYENKMEEYHVRHKNR